MQSFKRVAFHRIIREFANLPIGMDEDDLLKIVCEFKLGRLQNKDKFILAFTRLAVRQAIQCAKHDGQVDDIIGIGLGALCQVPQEVADGKLLDFNILPYAMSRVRTRCKEFVRKDYILATSYHGLRNGSKPLDKHELLDESAGDPEIKLQPYLDKIPSIYLVIDNTDKIEERLTEAIKTEGERLVIKYRRLGYNDTEIAAIFGSTEKLIHKYRNAVEARYDSTHD